MTGAPSFPPWLEDVAVRRGLRPSFCHAVLRAASGVRVEPRSALALEYLCGDGRPTGKGLKLVDELERARRASRPSTLKAEPDALRAMIDEAFAACAAGRKP